MRTTLSHYLQRLRFKRIARHAVTHNVLALYAVQGATYLLPLVSVPYLARVLGPETWGIILFTQAFAMYLTPLMEYGLLYSAARTLARCRDDRAQVSSLAATILGVRALVLPAVLFIACAAWWFIPALHMYSLYTAWGIVGVFLGGMVPLWYYSGTERLTLLSVTDISSRVLVLTGMFLLVHHPADGWRILALQAAGNALRATFLLGMQYREVPWQAPDFNKAIQLLRSGWGLFVLHSVRSLSNSANSFILGVLASPVVVGFYGGGERITTLATSLFAPFISAIFPRMNRLATEDRTRAVRLFVHVSLLIGGMGLFIGLMIGVYAPGIVNLIFGAPYQPVVPVLRLLAYTLPFYAVHSALGMLWLVPAGQDTGYTVLVLSGYLASLAGAILTVPHWGPVGLAASVGGANFLVMMGSALLTMRSIRSTRLPNETPLPAPVSGEVY